MQPRQIAVDVAAKLNVYGAIERERQHQDAKRGTPKERDLSIGDYLAILRSELAEAEEAFVRRTAIEALCEILQVAATAVACMERHGVVPRQGLDPRHHHITE